MQEPKRAQNPQEAQTFAGDGCEEGKDRDHIGPSRRMGKFAYRVGAHIEWAQKSARIRRPKIRSSHSSQGARAMKEVPIINRMVLMSKTSKP